MKEYTEYLSNLVDDYNQYLSTLIDDNINYTQYLSSIYEKRFSRKDKIVKIFKKSVN